MLNIGFFGSLLSLSDPGHGRNLLWHLRQVEFLEHGEFGGRLGRMGTWDLGRIGTWDLGGMGVRG